MRVTLPTKEELATNLPDTEEELSDGEEDEVLEDDRLRLTEDEDIILNRSDSHNF